MKDLNVSRALRSALQDELDTSNTNLEDALPAVLKREDDLKIISQKLDEAILSSHSEV